MCSWFVHLHVFGESDQIRVHQGLPCSEYDQTQCDHIGNSVFIMHVFEEVVYDFTCTGQC
jgi:hypothetical protein